MALTPGSYRHTVFQSVSQSQFPVLTTFYGLVRWRRVRGHSFTLHGLEEREKAALGVATLARPPQQFTFHFHKRRFMRNTYMVWSATQCDNVYTTLYKTTSPSSVAPCSDGGHTRRGFCSVSVIPRLRRLRPVRQKADHHTWSCFADSVYLYSRAGHARSMSKHVRQNNVNWIPLQYIAQSLVLYFISTREGTPSLALLKGGIRKQTVINGEWGNVNRSNSMDVPI